MRRTTINIVRDCGVKMYSDTGYHVAGNGDAVCFVIDPVERAYVASSATDEDCPCVLLFDEKDDGLFTEISFPEFKGWRFHAGGGGKSINIALVRRDALKEY